MTIQGLRNLQPVAAPANLSEITWYGNDGYVAFSWYNPDYEVRFLSQATLGSNGFGSMNSNGGMYDPSLVIYSSDIGYYAMVPETGELDFLVASPSDPIFHGNVAVAPKGKYVGLSSMNALQIYRATDTTKPPEVQPLVSSNGCSTILGWAAAQVSIACVDESPGVVVSHAIDTVHASVTSAPIQGSEAYAASAWQGHTRLISPSGAWMALGSASDVFMANLGESPPAIAWKTALRGVQTPVAISFSPSEQMVALEDGGMIRVFATGAGGFGVDIADVASLAKPCQEQHLSAPDWCGRQAKLKQPVWSADSQLLALTRDDKSLVTFVLRDLHEIEVVEIASDCSNDCIGTGEFQP